MNGYSEHSTDGDCYQGDQDDDGAVSPEIVVELIVRCQLDQGTTKEAPCEEAFLGSTHPRLKWSRL